MTQALTCQIIEKLLQHYIDGELSPAETQSVEWHVTGCRSCRQVFVDLKRTVLLVESLPRVQAHASLLAGVMAAVQQEQRPMPARSLWPQLATLVAVVLAIAGTVLALVAGSEPLLSALDDVLDDPASLLDAMVNVSVGAELPMVLITCLLLLGGAAVMAHLVRSELPAHPA